MNDARYEDGSSSRLRLRAKDEADLKVISTLIQDAIFTKGETAWNSGQRDYTMILNRFRWESGLGNNPADQPPERVRSLLRIADVISVNAPELGSEAIPPACALLQVAFDPGLDGTGTMTLAVSGDYDVVIDVECVEVTLTDISDPYPAASANPPAHDSA